MSWYIRYLLTNSQEIKEKYTNPFNGEISFTSFEDSESFDVLSDDMGGGFLVGGEVSSGDEDLLGDLFLVEKKIEELYNKGIITDSDLELLDSLSMNPRISKLKFTTGLERAFISERFLKVCNTIAFYMGKFFTDEGYTEYMKEKYNLTEEQRQAMLEFMTSIIKE